MTELLQPGLKAEVTRVVAESSTAAAMGSGDLAVLATPLLVALAEAAACAVLQPLLPPEITSVGTGIDLRHMAATPVGVAVRAQATLTAVEGRKLTFMIEAWDSREKIGEGVHERFLVQRDKFLARAGLKSLPSAGVPQV